MVTFIYYTQSLTNSTKYLNTVLNAKSPVFGSLLHYDVLVCKMFKDSSATTIKYLFNFCQLNFIHPL